MPRPNPDRTSSGAKLTEIRVAYTGGRQENGSKTCSVSPVTTGTHAPKGVHPQSVEYRSPVERQRVMAAENKGKRGHFPAFYTGKNAISSTKT